MKIKIDSDVYDIVERIKEIDEGYFIIYNTDNGCFELHNYNQFNTYCLRIPYDSLDERVISLIYKTLSSNLDNIIKEIDEQNEMLEDNKIKSTRDVSDYKLREVYKFANNSSKDLNGLFESCWR